MGKRLLLLACIPLVGFIGYGIWDATGGWPIVFSYDRQARRIVDSADSLLQRYKAGKLEGAELKEDAADLRARMESFRERCEEKDRRRPSCPKIAEIVDQAEAAARQPELQEMMKARMATIERFTGEVREILGSDQDKAE